MARLSFFIFSIMIPLAISVIPGKVKDSTQGYKEQSYTMNLVAIKELWDRCAVMTLLKAKAKAILKTDAAYISFDEHLFYRQCEKEAQTPVKLAKCLVALMNARDRPIIPIDTAPDDTITFWDIIFPWKRMARTRKIPPKKIIIKKKQPYFDWNLDLESSSFVQEKSATTTYPPIKRIYIKNVKLGRLKKKIKNRKMSIHPVYPALEEKGSHKFFQTKDKRLGKYGIFKIMDSDAGYYRRRFKRKVVIQRNQTKEHNMTSMEKLKILKEFKDMEKHAQEFQKRINKENSNFMRQNGFPFNYETEPAKNLSFVEDLFDVINSYIKINNKTEFKGINILSPRIMPLFPRKDKDGKPMLMSPTILSFQKEGFFSWPEIFKFFSASQVDLNGWIEFILKTSGADKTLDMTLKLLKNDIREMKEKVYPMVLEMEKMEKDWSALSKLHNHKQKRSLDRYGYAFMEPEQIELAYRNKFIQNHGMNLTEYAKMASNERERLLEEDIRQLAKVDDLYDENGNSRHKRQASAFKTNTGPTDFKLKFNVLSPSAFTQRINQGLILKGVILSPAAFTTEINNLVLLTHLTLSPLAFNAAILNPSILFSRVLSPVTFRLEVLHPRILHAWVLSPSAFTAWILSPRILQARVMSDLHFTLIILSPGIVHPRAGSPDGPNLSILSPQIWSPRILSPNLVVINVLSPPIMSDPLDGDILPGMRCPISIILSIGTNDLISELCSQMARKRKIFGIQNQVEIKKLKTKKSGREKIYIGDFGFHFGHENKMDFVYYCEQRDKPDVQCKASIRLLKGSGKIVPRTEHTHNAEKGNIEAQMVKEKLYEESGTHLLENPRDLISRVVGNSPAEVLNRLPTNLDRMVRLMKEQAGVNLKNPKRLNDIDIDQLKSLRYNGEELFYHDTGLNDGERALIFATKTNLEVLKKCAVIAIDGTFKARPKLFAQLLTIHGRVDGRFIPLVFILASHKSTRLYSRILMALPELALLKFTISDFESSILEAIATVFPRCTRFGCLFHFKKCIDKKFKFLGWKKRKSVFEDIKFKRCLKRFGYLGYSKIEDLAVSFENLFDELASCNIASAESLNRFKNYMKDTWIGRDDLNPLYSVQMWNWYLSTNMVGIRTNNAVEAWNLAFTESINTKGHPGLNRFLNCLIQEHNSIHKMIHTTPALSLSQQESVIRSIIDEYDKPRYVDNCAEYFNDIVEAYKSFKST